MKKIFFKILLLVFILIVIDGLVGYLFNYLQYHSKGGDTGRMVYIANNMNEDILIFGSSRAIHHYDPKIIEDSLHMSCYNCGRDGNGIIFSYGMYRLFRDRYTPKIIIYDIIAIFDLINEGNNEKYLDWLRYFYERPGIDSIFMEIDETEKYKMLPKMRRYNGKFIQIASDYIKPQQSDIKGYRPVNDIMKYEPTKTNQTLKQNIQYDNTKLKYFKKLIDDCKRKGTQLIFMVSPIYKGDKDSAYEAIIRLAESEKIPFFYHYNDKEISFNREYFYDSAHMNKNGAECYTKKIIDEIRKCINNDSIALHSIKSNSSKTSCKTN